MQVLHDWSDVKSRKILTEMRKAIGHSGATLVIMETSFTGVLCTIGAITCCSYIHTQLTMLQTRWMP